MDRRQAGGREHKNPTGTHGAADLGWPVTYGSPEFVASFNAAIATKVVAPEGRLLSLLQAYQQSTDFRGLRDRTRADYVKQITKIEQKFGDAPIKALADPRTRGIFLGWRDELVLSWAKDRGKIPVNPCERGGRVYHGKRVDFVWSVEDEGHFSDMLRRNSTCRSCSGYGPGSGRAISCASRGPPMMGLTSDCGSRRRARVWLFQ